MVALNLAPAVPDFLRMLSADPMSLGLDLRGGVHFLMQVDMQAAITKALDRYQGDFRSTMRQQKIRYTSVNRVDETLLIKFKDQDNLQQGLQELKDNDEEKY